MLIFFAVFVAVSALLIPLAWIIGIIQKVSNISDMNMTFNQKVINVGIFIPFGPIILSLDLLSDMVYFWKNSFRKNLKTNTIDIEDHQI